MTAAPAANRAGGRKVDAGNDAARANSDLLRPLVARVIDLGRGPPALVSWIASRVCRGPCPKKLAGSLARTLRRAGSQTADARTVETIREGPPRPSTVTGDLAG